jgi:hypothetical protein
MHVLKVECVNIMSTLKKVFPLDCFGVMTHLVMHLIELDLCGPIHTRWMYPMEKVQKALKGFIRNMTHSNQGSMAIGYSIEEALGFCIEYIQGVNNTKRKVWDDKEKPTMHDEVFEGNGRPCKMNVNLKN